MSARAPKIMGARALKNNGCAPSFFQKSISWTYFFHVHFAFVHSFSIWLFFEWWVLVPFWIMGARALLNNGCSSTQKDGCSRPLKIMGARPHFFKRAFHKLYFLHVHLCPFTCALLSCLWIMSARALLNNGCSSPLKIMGAGAPKKMGARAP